MAEPKCPHCGQEVEQEDMHYMLECGVCKMCYDMWGDCPDERED